MCKYMDAVVKRVYEFKTLGELGEVTFDFRPFICLTVRADLKTELAFCISTANSSAESGIRFQKMLESGNWGREDIERYLRVSGVRFWRRKAEYIEKALRADIQDVLDLESYKARKLLVKRVKGLGYKEASHYLRNIGRLDVAILDRHVIRWMIERGYEVYDIRCERGYVKTERVFCEIAEERGYMPGEFDLIVWCEMTGKVLK